MVDIFLDVIKLNDKAKDSGQRKLVVNIVNVPNWY